MHTMLQMNVKTWHPDPRLSWRMMFTVLFSFFFLLFLGKQTFSELAGEELLPLVFIDSVENGGKRMSCKCYISFMMWLLFTSILKKTLIFFFTALFCTLASDQTVSSHIASEWTVQLSTWRRCIFTGISVIQSEISLSRFSVGRS